MWRINVKENLQGLKHVYLWLALGFVFLIIISYASDIKDAKVYFQALSVELIIGCLSLAALSYGVRSLRWLGYMRLVEHRASITHHIIIYLSGFAFTVSPGKSGELMRGAHLDELSVPFRYTFFSFVSERLLDVIMVFVLGTYFLVEHVNPFFSVWSVCVFILPFCVTPALNLGLRVTRIGKQRYDVRMIRDLYRMIILVKSLCLTVLAWSAQGAILYWVLRGYGIDLSIAMIISIYCLSLLIGAISLVPSGLGVTEIGMIWLLGEVGVENDVAIASSLVTRMMTLLPAMTTGLLCSLILKRNCFK